MAATVPYNPPIQFSAGDSVTWKVSEPDYPAPTYSLQYVFHSGTDKISVESAASGSEHLVTLSTTDTAAYVAGQYTYKCHAVKSGERWFVDEGIITILPDFSAETTVDTRTAAKRQLAAAEAAIEGIVSGRLSSYTTTSGTFTKLNLNDLRSLRNELQARVNREQGKGGAVTILARFSSPR